MGTIWQQPTHHATTVQQGESNARGLAEIARDRQGGVAHGCGFCVPNVTAAAANQGGARAPPRLHRHTLPCFGKGWVAVANQTLSSPAKPR